MSLTTLVSLLAQNSTVITLLAGWIGAKLHTLASTKKTDAAHQQLNTIVQSAVTAALQGFQGTPNGANGDK